MSKFGKTLVIYYSVSGNTALVAKNIQLYTSGDICEIKTKAKYSIAKACLDCLKKKVFSSDVKPELEFNLPDIKQYQTIFIGSPVYAWSVPAVMCSFLDQVDFEQKEIIVFSTSGGSPGKYFEDFSGRAKNAKCIKGQDFKVTDKEKVGSCVKSWLDGI
jgi:flavodoxin